MRFVFAGYIQTPEFKTPSEWRQRLAAYFGVLEALAKQHEVISIEQIGYEGDHHCDGVDYRFMNFGSSKQYFPWKLHRTIKRLSPNIVIIHGTDHPLQVLQLRMMLGKSVKIILQSHGKEIPAGFKGMIQRIASRHVDAFFFTSKTLSMPWLDEGLIMNEKKVYEVMVGSSVFRCRDKQQARFEKNIGENIVYLWVGRLNVNKDPLTLIKAFHRFSKDCPQARLYMIYQTDERLHEIKDWLVQQAATASISLEGKTPHEEMELWYNAADFFISSSHFEVYGAVVAESMSCMAIPILSDIPAFRKMTGNGACGLLYTAGDEEALYRALRQSIQLDREEERQKARAHFEANLSFPAIAGSIQEIAGSL
jgi:glycosyltransferase involved in cell wall biosynthesis